MFKLWKKIESLGITRDMDSEEFSRLRITRNLWLVGLIAIPIFIVAGILTHTYISVALLSSLWLLILFCFYLSIKGNSDNAAFLSIIGISTYLFANTYLIKADVGLAFILLGVIAFPAIIIDLKKKYLLLSAMFIPSALLIVMELLDFTQIGIYELTPLSQTFFHAADLLLAVILAFSEILFFVREMNRRYELYKEQQDNLVQQGIMSDLGMMSAGIAHEINNPLTIIKLFSVSLGKHVSTIKNEQCVDACNSDIQKIDENIGRIVKIINGIKHLARNSENDEFLPLSVSKVLFDLHELFESRFKKLGISFLISPPTTDVSVMCRGAQIEQVLVSLLSNAIDALTDIDGAEITLKAAVVEERVLITVQDNGDGISPEHGKHVMKSFYSTKPIGKGTGIGLSIAKRIIEDHKGELSLVSLKPATFQVSLPLADAKVEASLEVSQKK